MNNTNSISNRIRSIYEDRMKDVKSNKLVCDLSNLFKDVDKLVKEYNEKYHGLIPEINVSINGSKKKYCLEIGSTIDDLLRINKINYDQIKRIFVNGKITNDVCKPLSPYDNIVIVI